MPIGLISLEAKCAGARSEGNPHAACEVAGTGNGVTDLAKRARRGKPRIQPSPVLTGHRASSRPYIAFALPIRRLNPLWALSAAPEPLRLNRLAQEQLIASGIGCEFNRSMQHSR